MHNRNGTSQVMHFQSLKDYEEAVKAGWVFNPADLKIEKAIVVEEPKVEEVKEDIEISVRRPSVFGEPAEVVEPFACKLCDFKGKSEQSLKMHKIKTHRGK